MCDDSRSEKRYWMRRVDELRRQMEREELAREVGALPGTATGSVEPAPLPVARAGWRLGSIVACAVVALSLLLFSAMSPAATFVYVSNGAFSVDSASGKLAYLGSTPTEKQPRGFRIDPAGRFMVVSGEKSETLSVYSIDAATGALKAIGQYPTGKGSNWVEIVTFD